jgi:hypothetical protein
LANVPIERRYAATRSRKSGDSNEPNACISLAAARWA